MKVDVLVVGSGAGGAAVAATLAEAGVRVLVLEEGPAVADPGPQFSYDQMQSQYRNHGETVALGLPPINYAEGRCVGGSTEINSGLYHRPYAELIDRLAAEWSIEDLTMSRLEPICERIEAALSISSFPDAVPPASQLLQRGADRLGWRASEIPRWFRFDAEGGGQRQTMSRTYLTQAEKNAATVMSQTWVKRLNVVRGVAESAEVVHSDGTTQTIGFDQVFVCGGAIQTPALLQRSGITKNVGRTLAMHPTVKAVAHSREPVNDPRDVPVVQVREFSPLMTIGGSATTLPLLGLALMPTGQSLLDLPDRLPHLPIYYAAIRTEGRGRVRALPRMRDPLVTYRLTGTDMARLRQALGRLLEVLLASDTLDVTASVRRALPITGTHQIPGEVDKLIRRTADVMTVHLCATVPMGEDRRRCAVDSFGRSHEAGRLVVSDASILNEAPGINPQATVMALAIRNAEKYLEDRGVRP